MAVTPAAALEGDKEPKKPAVDVIAPSEEVIRPGQELGPEMGRGAWEGPPEWLDGNTLTLLAARDTGAYGPLTASDLMNREVIGAGQEAVGEVTDVLLGLGDRAPHLIVDTGGFLGLADREVAISFDRVHLRPPADPLAEVPRLVVNLTEQQVAELPAYDRDSVLGPVADLADEPDLRRLFAQRIAAWDTRIEEIDLQANPAVQQAWTTVERTWKDIEQMSGDAFERAGRELNEALNDLRRAWARSVDEGTRPAPPQQAEGDRQ